MKTKKARMLGLLTLCLLAALVALAAPASADRVKRVAGACCLPDGVCCDVSGEPECDSMDGVYHHARFCDENPCSPIGGVTDPLAASVMVVPALAVAAMVGASAATAALIKRRPT